MYNEIRKQKFMDEMTESTVFGRSVFNTTEPYEQDAERDLCELPTETLQNIVDRNFGSRLRSIEKTISYMRLYVTWCKEHGYPVRDGIYSVKAQMDEKMKRYMVASPKHLQAVLDKSFLPVESETVDCIYRCYIWMAFAGMDDRDTIDVRVDEVNFGTMLIEHDGRSFELYRESIPAFRMSCEATEFKYQHVKPTYTKVRERFPGEFLMRGIRSDKLKLTTIKSVVQKAFNSNGIELTYTSIRRSGLFYRAYETERLGFKVNFDDFVLESISKSSVMSANDSRRRKAAYIAERDLFSDYACWKAVFT